MRPPRTTPLPRPSGPRAGRASLRLVVPVDDPAPTADPFVENDTMPTINLSTDTPMTFTFRGTTVPTVEALCAELSARRAAGDHANPEAFTVAPAEHHYGRPKVVITGTMAVAGRDGRIVNADESVVATFTWDHTVWSLIEAAEIARGYEGAVYVGQDVHVATGGGEDDEEVEEDGTLWVDEGFEVQVADFRPAYVQDESLSPSQRAAAYLAAHPDMDDEE